MHYLDLLIILSFISFCLYSGLKERKVASKGLEEYFLAGRTANGWAAGVSMAATQFSADTPLLVTGLVATRGVFSLWQIWIYALSFLFLAFVLAGSWRRSGVVTDAEFTEFRYSSSVAPLLRLFKAIYFGIIFNCTVLAWVFFAAGIIAEPFLLWDQWIPSGFYNFIKEIVVYVGVPLNSASATGDLIWIKTTNNLFSIFFIVAITASYSMLGGLRSVISTDVLQFVLMMFGSLAYAVIVVYNLGGLAAMKDKLFLDFPSGGIGGIKPDEILAFTPSRAFDLSFPLLMVFSLQWLIQLNSDGTGYLAQRIMACKSEKDAKIAAIFFTFLQVLVRSLIWLPIAIGLLMIFPPDANTAVELVKLEREATFVRGISELLPIGIKGLMITAMIAALASTVDTHLNWGASYITNDIVKRFIYKNILKKEPKPQNLVWIARASSILLIFISFIIMTHLKSINDAWQASLLLGAGMGIVLILRWLWWRVNSQAELSLIIFNMFLAPVLLLYVDQQAWRLLIMAISSIFVILLAIRIWGPENIEHLKLFYIKAKPLGFWGPVAKSLGNSEAKSRTQLLTALLATVCSALSLFCFLVAIGSFIIGSSAPTWFPNRNLWLASLMILGSLSLPICWKLGFKDLELD